MVIEKSLLAEFKNKHNIVVGKQQVRRGLLEGVVSLVVLAVDTTPKYQLSIIRPCQIHNVPITRVGNAKALGIAVGINVKAGCVGILNSANIDIGTVGIYKYR